LATRCQGVRPKSTDLPSRLHVQPQILGRSRFVPKSSHICCDIHHIWRSRAEWLTWRRGSAWIYRGERPRCDGHEIIWSVWR
jgi:hypothetical protein